MMKYVIRVKPFVVLIKNRMANMTLVVCATRLVDEPRSDEEKRDTLLTKEPSTEENCQPEKQFTKTFSKLKSFFHDHIKLFASFTV